MFETRRVWPTASCPGKRLSAMVWPTTTTRAAERTSASVKKEPSATDHLRISGNCSETPCTCVDQFWLPATSCERELTTGETIETLGTSRRMASRSSTVSGLEVLESPAPPRTPPTFCAPAETKRRLVPMLAICDWTVAEAPCPMLTITMTAETPMMMPSMVKAARDLLRASARKAMRMMARTFILFNPLPRPLRRPPGGSSAPRPRRAAP
jgi:hypothetical protein